MIGFSLTILIILGISTGFISFSDMEFQVAYLFISGLLWSILWVHLQFPVPHLHYWSFHNKISFLQYTAKPLLPYLILSIALALYLLLRGTLLVAFIGIPPLLIVLNALIFMGIGEQSLAWRTGKRGNTIRKLAKETGAVSSPLGSIPGLLRTLLSAISSVLVVLLLLHKSWTFWLGFYLMIIVGFTLVFFMNSDKTGIKTIYRTKFISDNAFFDEYFLVQDSLEALKPVPIDSLFWIPKSMRSNIRFLLTQHLRINAISRFYFTLNILTWILLLIDVQWLTPSILITTLAFGLLIEMSLFFSKSMGAVGLHQRNSLFQLFMIHFFSMIRWLPLSSISLYFITSLHWQVLLGCFVFISMNSLIQAYIFQIKIRSIYG
jgi:hypothetical protein